MDQRGDNFGGTGGGGATAPFAGGGGGGGGFGARGGDGGSVYAVTLAEMPVPDVVRAWLNEEGRGDLAAEIDRVGNGDKSGVWASIGQAALDSAKAVPPAVFAAVVKAALGL